MEQKQKQSKPMVVVVRNLSVAGAVADSLVLRRKPQRNSQDGELPAKYRLAQADEPLGLGLVALAHGLVAHALGLVAIAL